MKLFAKVNLLVLIVFYVGAGINHFWHPVTYRIIIPPYFPYHNFLVDASGVAEILLGLTLFSVHTRKLATIGIVLLLIAVLPVHIYMIQLHGCVTKDVCISNQLAWIRFFLQFILIAWAWKTYVWTKNYSFGL